jgi:UDP-N-acetylglucosamine 1-carboxyvinyltransferase
MDLKVKGEQVLSGDIFPSGSKNSSVAIISASILFDEMVTITNVPNITDVSRLVSVLKNMGSKISWNEQEETLEIDNSELTYRGLDEKDLRQMRGSSLLWGPMLSRFGEVDFSELPGGCTLGFRTLEPHYKAFTDLGVKIKDDGKGMSMDTHRAKAGEIWLSEMSPTATENTIMLALGIKGKTKLIGAASDPQVQDLCNFLVKCGAKIGGIGSNLLEIKGGKKLSAKKHEILSDHNEIATFLALGAVTGGEVKVHNALPELFQPIIDTFSKFGIEVKYENDLATVSANQKIKIKTQEGRGTLFVKAQPWPALPVDILPLFIPLALAAEHGHVVFHNWMYEAGLFWTSELQKLGADVVMADPHRVMVIGGNKLHCATLEAPYIIRAVVAMVMCAMIAEGESLILNADALYRGHPNFSENLRKLGAKIEEYS